MTRKNGRYVSDVDSSPCARFSSASGLRYEDSRNEKFANTGSTAQRVEVEWLMNFALVTEEEKRLNFRISHNDLAQKLVLGPSKH